MSKYDWSGVPKEVKFIATDSYSGKAWGYLSKPRLGRVSFIEHVSEFPIYVGVEPYKGNWQDSLEERPK